ncbi:MAG: hypothetical protein ACXVDC_16265 [Bacteroidia bacterium]
MKKKLFLLWMVAGVAYMNAQTPAKKKTGSYKVTEVVKDKSLPNKAKVTFKFVGPNNKPVKSNVKFVYNNDSLFPVINEEGKYTISMIPGKYKMRFAVPYWHEVSTDSIMCHKQSLMTILVKFEAKDF